MSKRSLRIYPAHRARIKFVAAFVVALLTVKGVNLVELACAFAAITALKTGDQGRQNTAPGSRGNDSPLTAQYTHGGGGENVRSIISLILRARLWRR